MVTFVNGNGLRSGYVIKVKGDLYRVMAAEHRTPGKGRAFMQAKLRKLRMVHRLKSNSVRMKV